MSHPPMNSVSDAREKSRGSPLRCEIKIPLRLDLLRQQFESGARGTRRLAQLQVGNPIGTDKSACAYKSQSEPRFITWLTIRSFTYPELCRWKAATHLHW
jgi:hypothetical protein